MTDEADSSVVLAELQVALFRECNNQKSKNVQSSHFSGWLVILV